MKLSENLAIRKARLEDTRGIHDANMLSIQTICAQDHTSEEIKAWGHRPFNQAQRLNSINNHLVWVIEFNGKIEGYGHLKIDEKDGIKNAHIMGLYFTETIKGLGLGSKTFDLMKAAAIDRKAQSINLESTLTAHGFYKKLGFKDVSAVTSILISGTPIRCILMTMNLNVNFKQTGEDHQSTVPR